jgi:hypothetical protein
MTEQVISEEIKLEQVISEVVKRKKGRPFGSKNGSVDKEEARMKHNEFMREYYKTHKEVMVNRAKKYSKEKYHSDPEFKKKSNERANNYRIKQLEKFKQLEDKLKEFNDKLV